MRIRKEQLEQIILPKITYVVEHIQDLGGATVVAHSCNPKYLGG